MTLPIHIANELRFRFGVGASRLLKGAATVTQLQTGIVGSGGKGTKGGGYPVDVDDGTRLRVGHVDRVLSRLTVLHRSALEAVYGDLGSGVTEGGLYPSRRWRVVAPLTGYAFERGAAWAAVQKPRRKKKARTPEEIQAEEAERDPTAGPPAFRWVNHVLASTKREDIEHLDELRAEAVALLDAAEVAVEKAWRSVEADTKATQRTSTEAAAKAGRMAWQR